MKLKLVDENNEVLKEVSKAVTNFDGKLKTLAQGLHELMLEKKGVGISAVQAGKLVQLLIIGMKLSETSPSATVMVNPVIVAAEGLQENTEGCLSFPGLWVRVQRPYSVWVKYQDLQGKKHSAVVQGLAAAVVCHEIDHLKGKTIKDSLSQFLESSLPLFEDDMVINS